MYIITTTINSSKQHYIIRILENINYNFFPLDFTTYNHLYLINLFF